MKWLFIDGSYYIFYRFYALHIWWQNARKDQPLDDPIENKEFVEKFEKTFISKIGEFKKKMKIEDAYVVVGKDCPRQAPAARTWVWPCLRALDSYLALIALSLGSVCSFSCQDRPKAMHNPMNKSFGIARLRSQLLLPRPPQSNAHPE